jgi:hypothetical protein
MRTDTLTIQPVATVGAATEALPEHALGARAARLIALVATILATTTTTAFLLVSGLAVTLNLP